MMWQPIETAPKDGTPVDLWVIDETMCGAREPDACFVNDYTESYYYERRWVSKTRSGWRSQHDGYEGDGRWVDEPEWADANGNTRFVRATHWMPLPSPPEAK